MKKNYTLLFALLSATLLNAQVINVPGDQSTIQAAIETASEGDTVLVEEGLYYENINFLGKAITVGSRFLLDADTTHISRTIIDGSQSINPDTASVVTMWSGEDTTSILMGFTVTGGTGTYVTEVHSAWDYDYLGGGGILIYNSGGKICNNIIKENHITDPMGKVRGTLGCGILATVNHDHSAIIRGNTIRNNSGTDNGAWGGGMSLHGGRFLVENNAVTNNILQTTTIYAVGAGILFENEGQPEVIPKAVIRNNLISQNKSFSQSKQSYGGGISISMGFSSGGPEIYNNLITDNYVEGYAGGLYGWENKSVIFNNTLINNIASVKGNDLGLDGNCSFILYNNIFWSDVENGIPEYYFFGSGNSIQAYNNILTAPFPVENWVTSSENISEEPVFLPDSYELAEFSPGVGQGVEAVDVNGAIYFAPPFDFKDSIRPHPIDAFVDIGALESPFLHINRIESLSLIDLKIFPNPSTGQINIETEFPNHYFIEVTSTNGQVIHASTMEGNAHQIDLSSFQSGIYIITISSKHLVATRKIIKLRK